jgi:hypothetical protein
MMTAAAGAPNNIGTEMQFKKKTRHAAASAAVAFAAGDLPSYSRHTLELLLHFFGDTG